MGLFRKSKTEEKEDPFKDDPVQAEVNRYREEQRRKLGGGSSDDTTTPEPRSVPEERRSTRYEEVRPEPRSPSPTLEDPAILPPPPESEYQCSGCNGKFKESWNRCPKCGGDVKPVGLDQPEDMKKLYPDRSSDGVILPHHPLHQGRAPTQEPAGQGPAPHVPPPPPDLLTLSLQILFRKR